MRLTPPLAQFVAAIGAALRRTLRCIANAHKSPGALAGCRRFESVRRGSQRPDRFKSYSRPFGRVQELIGYRCFSLGVAIVATVDV
jgi:hypothetical protein